MSFTHMLLVKGLPSMEMTYNLTFSLKFSNSYISFILFFANFNCCRYYKFSNSCIGNYTIMLFAKFNLSKFLMCIIFYIY